jgi:hypothetical protein
MSDSERTVPISQAIRMLTTGFEWEAGLFFEVYEELCKRLGKEEAKKLMAQSMYRAGLKLGEEASAMVDRHDAIGMAKAWDIIYGAGTKEAKKLDKDHFVFEVGGCAAFELFKRWGMSDEEICFIGDAYCAGDVGQAEGFGDKLHFQHTHRLMKGDKCCEWVYTTSPQEPVESAVPKDDLEK